MLTVSNRNNARTLSAIINKMVGYKLTKQARSKIDGAWPIPYTKGTLRLPPAVNRSIRVPAKPHIERVELVVGQDVLSAKSFAKSKNVHQQPEPMTAMSQAFQNAKYAH